MKALKITVDVGPDHTVRLPDEVPVGPAELVILVIDAAIPFETQDLHFFERVRAAYAERAAAAPGRFAVIDAVGERSQVWARVQQAVSGRAWF